MDLNYTITFSSERCHDCGLYWLRESARSRGRCPYCAAEEIDKARAVRDAALKSVSVYKGLLARKRK